MTEIVYYVWGYHGHSHLMKDIEYYRPENIEGLKDGEWDNFLLNFVFS